MRRIEAGKPILAVEDQLPVSYSGVNLLIDTKDHNQSVPSKSDSFDKQQSFQAKSCTDTKEPTVCIPDFSSVL